MRGALAVIKNETLRLSFIIILILLLAFSLKAQNFKPQIKVYQDSIFIDIDNFKIISIDPDFTSLGFENLPSRWSMFLIVEYNSKTYKVPLDSNVRSIAILPNIKSEGICNRVTYWTACDAVTIYEHGNGCTNMNDIVFNHCIKEDAYTIIEGVRAIPFYYERKKKGKRKK